MEKQLQELINKLRWMLSVLKPMEKQMLWDTPEHARYNVRKICDEEGLTFDQKTLLCSCVMQESGFDNTAKGYNRDKNGNITSTDHGVAQVNDYWHIGVWPNGRKKTYPSVEYVVNNPELMIRWMAKTLKRTGKLQPWSSWTTGAYKKWMNTESRPGVPY
jgi:hypothetical protein